MANSHHKFTGKRKAGSNHAIMTRFRQHRPPALNFVMLRDNHDDLPTPVTEDKETTQTIDQRVTERLEKETTDAKKEIEKYGNQSDVVLSIANNSSIKLDETIQSFAKFASSVPIVKVDLSGINLASFKSSNRLLTALATSPSLEDFCLAKTSLKPSQITRLLDTLATNPSLLHLNLNKLNVQHKISLETTSQAHAANRTAYQHTRNQLFIAIGLLLVNTNSLQSLDLSQLNIELNHIAPLSIFLSQNRTLKELTIDNNLFGVLGIQHILNAFSQSSKTTLQTLKLRYNDLQNEQLAINPQLAINACGTLLATNTSIRHLEIEGLPTTEILDYSPIFSALKTNRTLQVLKLKYGISMTDKAAKQAAEMLKENKTLTALHVGPSLTSTSISMILQALTNNRTLHTLELFGASYTCEHGRQLAGILKTNRTLCHVHFPLREHTFPSELNHALAHNRNLHEHSIRQWQRASILTSFLRANHDNTIRHSIFSLVPEVMKYVDEQLISKKNLSLS